MLQVSTSMTAINCDQFAQILDDKLSPLNSRIAELKKSVDEAMNYVNAKYDELLQMMKTSIAERKALQDENKILQHENNILKATIHSIERSLESAMRANHDLEQYTRRECMEIRGIPVAANPSEEQTNILSRMLVNYWEWILLRTTYQLAIKCFKVNNAKASLDHRLS